MSVILDLVKGSGISSARSSWNRWILLGVFIGCAASVSAQNVISPTRVVASSTEPIEFPFPRYENLPKTISFDYLTTSEIQKIREDIFAGLNASDYGKALYGENIGPTKCMQWLLLRDTKTSTWQAIGAMQEAKGIIKINGAFRTVMMSLSREIERSSSGKYRPRDILGGGGALLLHFHH